MNAKPATPMTSLKAAILRRQRLPGISSASGMEVVDNQIYIIGDDSLFLYVLSKQWELINTIPLLPGERTTGRIPKKQKPDFEMMTQFTYQGESMLMIAGSGSQSPERDSCFLVHLRDYSVTGPYSLKGMYEPLRSSSEVAGTGKLNLEGLAADEKHLYFLQRGNITGNNSLISYEFQSFYEWLTQPTCALPNPTVERFELPSFSGVRAGFSGATLIPHTAQILFTASVEDTTSEIDDGETLAGYVGIIQLHPGPSVLSCCGLLAEDGQPYAGKVESIAISSTSLHSIRALAVTDNDLGDSEIIELVLTW